MHRSVHRILALVAGIAAILSCDYQTPTGRFGSGISGGPTGTAPIVPSTGADTTDPFVIIDTPTTNQLVNIGDSLLVVVRFIDDRKIGNLRILGFTESGDTALGTFTRTLRYNQVTAPASGFPFQPGQTFATIRRYLQPTQPVDTTLGPMVVMAIGQDSAGNVDTATVTVQMVAGPDVDILAPANGEQVPRGVPMAVRARATHRDGVSQMTIRVQGEPTWTTLLDTTLTQTYPSGSRDVTLNGTVGIPVDAPIGGRITVTATAIDISSNPGTASPVTAFVRAAGSVAPSVCFAQVIGGQGVCSTLPDKLEISDSVLVKATGDGITKVGIIIRDTLGVEIRRDSVMFSGAAIVSNVVQNVALGLSLQHQGRRMDIIAFADDNNTPPRRGFSMPTGSTAPISVEANAFVARTLVTHGRTFPVLRSIADSVISDLAVDEIRGNVFLSNTPSNLLEVWNNATKSFAPDGIQVGAQPWGLFVGNNTDSLFVANSGSTTISRVCINPAVCAGGVMGENLAGRLRTRNSIVYEVTFTRDATTGKIRLVEGTETAYSDRPQYIAQSRAGRLFFSTKPTDAATPGTLRYFDPDFQFADTRQIWQYGTVTTGQSITYAIFNADSIAIGSTPPTSTRSDTLYIFDHVTNQAGPDFVVADSFPVVAVLDAVAAGSDAVIILGLSVPTLGLTDTTFVAASGDRSWIGFGEGDTPGFGRIMMVNDPLPDPDDLPGFFSPQITVTDIVHNAAERVFGIAIDSTGLQMAAHGLQTYVASVDNPFHLRLDGVYDSFDNGAGVAYHPRAKSTTTASANDRLLFTATTSGIIEIVDVAHYNNRGRLTTKGTFYGPLRVTGPLPGDPPEVVLKLYGLTSNGLVVIDVLATDIK